MFNKLVINISCIKLYMENKKRKINNFIRLVYPNGVIYEGYHINNIPNGFGKIIYTSNDILEGEFINGKLSGYYKLIKSNGTIYETIFK